MPPTTSDPAEPRGRYEIRLTPGAVRQLRKLDSIQRTRIRAALTKIAALDDPTSVGKRLVADDTIWRYRAGSFRILCTVDRGELLVLVVKIGHRRDVYRRSR